MSKLVSVFAGILIYLSAMGQDSISGIIHDGVTQRPLAKATVRIGHRNVRTDESGAFTLPFKEGEKLEVSAVGFHDYDRSEVDIVDLNRVLVYLVPKPSVKSLKISGNAVGVYEPDFEYIFDYEFINNQLIVGSYLNRNISNTGDGSALKNCALTLFDKGEMTHRILIRDFPQRLRKSAFDELFVQGLDYALIVHIEKGKLRQEKFDFQEFRSDVIPWTVAFSNSAFSVRIVREIPQVVHYCHHKDSAGQKVIRSARNSNYFSKTFLDYTMLDQDQKSQALALSEAQGFEKELYAGFIRASNGDSEFHRRQAFGSGVDRDLRPPYTPVYKKDGDVLILDAMNQWIYRHSQSGQAIDSVYFQIDLAGEELWRIEQDRVSEKLYSVHQKKGVYHIRELDPHSGALGAPMKLAYPFPKKIKIYNGNVFYIRHDAKEKIKHLYKEFLNFQ